MLKALQAVAEERGFEPPRRCYRPTGIRSRTLQPLGYSSILTLFIQRCYSNILRRFFPARRFLMIYLLSIILSRTKRSITTIMHTVVKFEI